MYWLWTQASTRNCRIFKGGGSMTSENADSTEPTINIDEAEMEVTLHLAGRIAVYVYDMSKRMGICPQEYLRFVIGSVVTKGMFIPGNDDPMLPKIGRAHV